MKTREVDYYHSFRDVVRAVSATLDVKEVLNLMVQRIAEVTGVKACAVRLLDPRGRTLELAASWGLSEAYLKKGPVDADRSIAEAMEGRPVFVEDARSDSRAQYGEEAARAGIASILSVPLTVKGRTIGVLRLYTETPRRFDPEEVDFVESLAEMGAVAIENARMYEKLKSDHEELMSDIYRFVGYRRSL